MSDISHHHGDEEEQNKSTNKQQGLSQSFINVLNNYLLASTRDFFVSISRLDNKLKSQKIKELPELKELKKYK